MPAVEIVSDAEGRPGARAPTVPSIDDDSRARTHLANERTVLAWLRTGLGLVVPSIDAAR